jgi:hypothetical protein
MFDPHLALAYLTGVLEAGERERVIHIKQTTEPFPYHESMGISYAKHLDNVLKEHGILVFGEHLAKADPYYTEGSIATLISSDLCYFDSDGNLVEGEVINIGDLLNQLRASEINDRDYPELYPNFPIKFRGFCIYSGQTSIGLTFELNTDIWLPEVWGVLESSIRYRRGENMLIDKRGNLELAKCHTPRLNRFLAEVKRLTLEYGGEWISDHEEGLLYADEDGIILPEIQYVDENGIILPEIQTRPQQ